MGRGFQWEKEGTGRVGPGVEATKTFIVWLIMPNNNKNHQKSTRRLWSSVRLNFLRYQWKTSRVSSEPKYKFQNVKLLILLVRHQDAFFALRKLHGCYITLSVLWLQLSYVPHGASGTHYKWGNDFRVLAHNLVNPVSLTFPSLFKLSKSQQIVSFFK